MWLLPGTCLARILTVLLLAGICQQHQATAEDDDLVNVSPGSTCLAYPYGVHWCKGVIDGVPSNSQIYHWSFRDVALGSWIFVQFNQSYTLAGARFMQLFWAVEKNFEELTLIFSDGSRQEVMFKNRSDGYVWEEFDLFPIDTKSVNVTVTRVFEDPIVPTFNGFVEIEFLAVTSTWVGRSTTTATTTTSKSGLVSRSSIAGLKPTAGSSFRSTFSWGTNSIFPSSLPTPPPSLPSSSTMRRTSNVLPSTKFVPTSTTTSMTRRSSSRSTPAKTTTTTLPPKSTTTTTVKRTVKTPPSTPPLTQAPPTQAPPTSSSSSSSAVGGNGEPVNATPPTEENKQLYIIIGAVVGGVVLLVIIIIPVVVCARRRRKHDKSEKNGLVPLSSQVPGLGYTGPLDDEGEGVYQNHFKSRAIKVDDLLQYIRTKRDEDTFKTEFLGIGSGKRASANVSEMKANDVKNRFKNIHAYDHNRVSLVGDGEDDATTFINANFIAGYENDKEYIAAQGPLKSTVADFWEMLWEHDCPTIIMVTNVVEKGRMKCEHYWPEDNSLTFKGLTIKPVGEKMLTDFIIRNFIMEKDGEQKDVEQYHFTTWPDEGAPDSCTALLLYQDLININTDHTRGPKVVHCSAGVGRTGTYIAVDFLRKQAAKEGSVDIVKCVDLMRSCRMNMVQSLEQYKYIYATVLEAIYCGNVHIPSMEFESQMYEKSDGSFSSRLEHEWNVLDLFKPHAYSQRCVAAKEADNVKKNRDFNTLPGDHVRPYLQPAPNYNSNYINAVLCDGYRKKDVYAATQMPLPHTQRDLWRLVVDFNCSVIVMLNEMDDETSPAYWPEGEGDTEELGPILVENMGYDNVDNIIVTELQVTAKHKENEVFNVRHIRLLDWPDDSALPETGDCLIHAYNHVLQSQKESATTGTVMVHCLRGSEKSGLFAAMFNVLEMINAEQAVDVFNAVKQIRRAQPAFIPSEKQYQFLYKLAHFYILEYDNLT